MSEWISVRDSLPEDNGGYLVVVHEPESFADDKENDERLFGIDKSDWSYVDYGHYCKEDCLWRTGNTNDWCFNANIDSVDTHEAYYISHWMPLPPLPSE